MQKSFTLTSLFILCSFLVQAQSNFRAGLVVTTAGDTLKGFIDHREWIRSPSEITFKVSTESPTEQKFTPTTSRYVEISGREAYVSERVSISTAPTANTNLSNGVDTTTRADVVFLKVLSAGARVSLYSYTDKVKPRFYLRENTVKASPKELLYRRYFVGGMKSQIAKDFIYRNQIWDLAIKYQAVTEAFQRKVETATYAEKDILALIRHLNGSDAPASTPSIVEHPKTRFFAGVWLNRSSMNFTGSNMFAEGAEYSSSYLPRVSVGLDAFANPSTQRLIFRTELSATMATPSVSKNITYTGSTTVYATNYKFSQLSASLNQQLLYNLYHTDNLKVYLGGGIIGTIAHYTQDEFNGTYHFASDGTELPKVDENYAKPKTFWYTYTARVGFILKNEFDVSFLYTNTDISSDIGYSLNNASTSLGISYLFNRTLRD